MIENKTIICFASGYEVPPTSKHHVMHILAEKNVVIWVNYHASRTPSASVSDAAYVFKKFKQVFAGVKKARPNLYVLTPLVVPLPGSTLAKKINRRLVISSIRHALKKFGRGSVQVWSFAPDVGYLAERLEPEKILYYCVDDFAHFSGYDSTQVLADETELAAKADVVITTSLALQESKKKLNPRTLLVPHGVDYDHFAKALDGSATVPDDVKSIAHPVIGFIGLIRDWVDLGLVAEVAKRRPQWHFVFVGDADSSVNLAPYRELANMHFLGRKPYSQMPGYCKHFDVGMIPFKINELTKAVNPIKLREYMAAGLPVASTPLPEVSLYADMIEMAGEPEEFEKAIERCLNYSERERRELSEKISRETWGVKVDSICDFLET